MQIEVTRRCYFMPIRMAIMEKKCIGEDMDKFDPLCVAGGNENGEAALRTVVTIAKKIKHGITIWSAIPLVNVTQKKRKQGLRYLCTHVHSSIVHNSQKVSVTQVCTDDWIDCCITIWMCLIQWIYFMLYILCYIKKVYMKKPHIVLKWHINSF